MLERLLVQNLGCFDENTQPVELSQETVLIGPNNSGKSTFIGGLNLLRTVVHTSNVSFANSLYNFHDAKEAVHNHQVNRIIKVSAVVDKVGLNMETHNGRVSKQDSSTGTLWNEKIKN